ncbi:hypothetical protein BDA99DRAFT_95221 [Phascolomyces articulosus]|uniref:Uncharacterized protein n=1 Tax=Phascolomyces articulosus TaxID=60185 RepID=A0AAD5PD50_9FUNG|nr:hypothetical protein BDA99DRAFT_95221 [Phascolomyces articulosus]
MHYLLESKFSQHYYTLYGHSVGFFFTRPCTHTRTIYIHTNTLYIQQKYCGEARQENHIHVGIFDYYMVIFFNLIAFSFMHVIYYYYFYFIIIILTIYITLFLYTIYDFWRLLYIYN